MREGLGTFGGKLKVIKWVVCKWQGDQFLYSMRRIQECEAELKGLVSSPTHSGQDELDAFQDKKKSMTMELNHL